MRGTRPCLAPVSPALGIALAIVVAVAHAPAASARAGDLDTAFGDHGSVLLQAGAASSGAAIALQPDGRIVAAGQADGAAFVLARLQPRGAPDAGFGGAGTGIATIPGPAGAQAVALQADGAIVAAGAGTTGSGRAAVARVHPDGTLDRAGFAAPDGVVQTTVDATATDAAYTAVALQADGRIVVAGTVTRALGDPADVVVARYLPDGTPDPSFAGDGTLVTSLGPGADAAAGLVVTADGRLVVGATTDDGVRLRGVVLRLLPDGTPDTSFGTAGRAAVDDGLGLTAGSGRLALQGDGRILVGGGARRATPYGVARGMLVARLRDDGTVDTSFGPEGAAFLTLRNGADAGAGGLAVQRNGEVLVAGVADTAAQGRHDAALACLDPDGTVSSSFGGGQPVVDQVDEDDASRVRALALEPDGGILAAGEGRSGDARLLVARWIGGCAAPRTPNPAAPPAPPVLTVPVTAPGTGTTPPARTRPARRPVTLRVEAPRQVTVARAARAGLTAVVRRTRAASVLAALGRGRRVLASATSRCAASGRCTVHLRPARAALARVLGTRRRSVPLELTLLVTTKDGERDAATRTVTLQRR